MAGFHTKTFTNHDDYMTPSYAWENIKNYIPKDKVLWEAFYGDGTSGTILQDLGYDCIHENIDFFENDENPVQIIMPRRRIHFLKMINGVVAENQKKACNFDCFYYCWKINLPRDIIWLTDDECVEMKKNKKKKVTVKKTAGSARKKRKKKEMEEAREMMKHDININ